jgi:NADH-quinone oxidoreductase subunit B
MEGLLLLREKIGRERRPLAWAMKDQRVRVPAPPCQRDRKRAERAKATVLRSPDEAE